MGIEVGLSCMVARNIEFEEVTAATVRKSSYSYALFMKLICKHRISVCYNTGVQITSLII